MCIWGRLNEFGCFIAINEELVTSDNMCKLFVQLIVQLFVQFILLSRDNVTVETRHLSNTKMI